jgi:hypothetical protein
MHVTIQLLVEGISFNSTLYETVLVHKTFWVLKTWKTFSPYHEHIITIDPVAVLVINRMFEKNVTDCPLSSVTVGNLCVQSDTEAMCFMFMLHV